MNHVRPTVVIARYEKKFKQGDMTGDACLYHQFLEG
jgi:hypothetical protein